MDSGFRFRVAARKKGVFSGQYPGRLEEPTFSTESADGCPSRLEPSGWKRTLLTLVESSKLGRGAWKRDKVASGDLPIGCPHF